MDDKLSRVECPGCRRSLGVPAAALGHDATCPHCGHVFRTSDPMHAIAAGLPPPALTIPLVPPPPSSTAIYDASTHSPPATWRDAYEPQYRPYTPHRGSMIVFYGVLALMPCALTALIFGVIAITRGQEDLNEMNYGNMDPRGENIVKFGRTLGYIGIFFWTLATVLVCMTRPSRF